MSWWLRLLCVAGSIAAACTPAANAPCNGGVCPSNHVCSEIHNRCVLRSQLSACDGRADGQVCGFGEVAEAECNAGVCLEPLCGDGILMTVEACDDGNTVPGDGCNATCTSDERCGNGIVDLEVGEACDCGDGTGPAPAACPSPNSADPAALCSDACTLRRCGDGLLSPGEDCDGQAFSTTCNDLGYDAGELACGPLCRFDTSACVGFCGDGVVDADELCDGDGPEGLSCRDLGAHFGVPGCTDACAPNADVCGLYTYRPIAAPLSFAPYGALAGRDGGVLLRDERGSLFRYRNSTWEKVADRPVDYAARGERLYVALDDDPDGIVRYFDGSTWTSVDTALGAITQLCATAAGALVVASREVAEVRGTQARRMTGLPAPSDSWSCVDTGADSYLMADGVAHVRTASGWSSYDVPSGASRLFPLASGELLAATPGGLWRQDRKDAPWLFIGLPDGVSLGAIASADSGQILAGSGYGGSLGYFNGSTWETPHPFHTYRANDVRLARVVRGDSRGEILGIVERGGQYFVSEVTRGLWTEIPIPADRVWWTGERALFSRGSLLFRTGLLPGRSRGVAVLPGRVTDVWSDNHTSFVVVDDVGNIATIAEPGGTVEVVSVPGAVFNGVGARFAVGAGGVVVDRERGWARVDVDTNQDLFDVASTPSGRAVAVGTEGVVLYFDGADWTKRTVAAGVTLNAAVAVGEEWFLAGEDGYLARFDGRDAQRFESATRTSLRALAATGPDNVYAVGDLGTALHFDGERWSPFLLPDNVGAGISAVAAAPDQIVVVFGGEAFRLNRPAF